MQACETRYNSGCSYVCLLELTEQFVLLSCVAAIPDAFRFGRAGRAEIGLLKGVEHEGA